MNSKLKLKGTVKVYDIGAEKEGYIRKQLYQGEKVANLIGEKPLQFDNMILNAALRQIAQGFLTIGETEPFTHISIGGKPGEVLPEDVMLEEEFVRLPITNIYIEDTVGFSVVVEVFVGTMEANFTWHQLGLVRGGTDNTNSGRLFSKVNKTVEKDANSAKTIVWQIKFNEEGEILGGEDNGQE